MPPKPCKPGFIKNPASGRCVDAEGPTGRKIRGLKPLPKFGPKPAPKARAKAKAVASAAAASAKSTSSDPRVALVKKVALLLEGMAVRGMSIMFNSGASRRDWVLDNADLKRLRAEGFKIKKVDGIFIGKMEKNGVYLEFSDSGKNVMLNVKRGKETVPPMPDLSVVWPDTSDGYIMDRTKKWPEARAALDGALKLKMPTPWSSSSHTSSSFNPSSSFKQFRS